MSLERLALAVQLPSFRGPSLSGEWQALLDQGLGGVCLFGDNLPFGPLVSSIRAVAPEASEALSYGVPAFKMKRPIVSFGAAKNHLALYVMSTAVMEAHRGDLKGYDTSAGTVRFAVDEPLPAALVEKLVKARIAENEASG